MEQLFHQLNRDNNLKNLDNKIFSDKLADFLSSLNAIHPWREGNGRIQNIFITLLSEQAGHLLDFNKIDTNNLLYAMINSLNGDNVPLQQLILNSIPK